MPYGEREAHDGAPRPRGELKPEARDGASRAGEG